MMVTPPKGAGIRTVSVSPADSPSTPVLSAADWRALQSYFDLTPRQKQTADLVCRALDNKQIAGELHISGDTVRMHLKEVFRKVGVESRTALLLKMLETQHQIRVGAAPEP